LSGGLSVIALGVKGFTLLAVTLLVVAGLYTIVAAGIGLTLRRQ
jgi:hypothetical protein